MDNQSVRIDLVKLITYLLKRCWIIILCAAIGFFAMYEYTSLQKVDTYTTTI